jgi:tetratricopeptide (TPR) repeat protein
MRKHRVILLVSAGILLLAGLLLVPKRNAEQKAKLSEEVVGDWQSKAIPTEEGRLRFLLRFAKDGRCELVVVSADDFDPERMPAFARLNGTYRLDGDRLSFGDGLQSIKGVHKLRMDGSALVWRVHQDNSAKRSILDWKKYAEQLTKKGAKFDEIRLTRMTEEPEKKKDLVVACVKACTRYVQWLTGCYYTWRIRWRSDAIRLNPMSAENYLNRGREYMRMNDVGRGIKDFDQALRLDPRFAWAHYNRGYAYWAKGTKEDFELAVKDFSEALRLGLHEPNLYRDRAEVYLALDKPESAIQDYTKALTLKPRDGDLLRSRGYAYLQKKDYDKAISDFSEILRFEPQNGDAFYYRASAYHETKNYDKAIEDFTKAMRFKVRYLDVMYIFEARAFVYQDKKDYDKAIEDFSEYIRREREPTRQGPYYNRGMLYLAKKDYDRAIADFSEAIQMSYKDSMSRFGRARAYSKKGEFAKAIEDFTEATKNSPGRFVEDASGYDAFAWFLATCPDRRFRDGKNALAYADKACKLSEWKNPSFIATLAAACAEDGQFGAAVKWQKKAMEIGFEGESDERAAQDRLTLYGKRRPFRDGGVESSTLAGKWVLAGLLAGAIMLLATFVALRILRRSTQCPSPAATIRQFLRGPRRFF